ncbi:MAG: hypothetical protein R3B81_15475 [bacterium]
MIRGGTGLLLLLLGLGSGPGCGPDETAMDPAPAPRSPETLAAEEKAGDFLAYYDAVVTLSRRYATEPDSFRVHLDALPGSRLTDAEWAAWTAPYRDAPRALADRLESAIARPVVTE